MRFEVSDNGNTTPFILMIAPCFCIIFARCVCRFHMCREYQSAGPWLSTPAFRKCTSFICSMLC